MDVDVVSDLFTVRLDGKGARRLTRTWTWETDPAWSPDRRRIAYSVGSALCHASTCEWGAPQTDIWVIAANGSRPRPLFEQSDEEYYSSDSPTWSPDSRDVAFARNDQVDGTDPENGIYVVAADGKTAPRRLSRAQAADLAWSPRGSQIAYVHRSYRYVGLLDVATRRARRLRVRGIASPTSVAWSPGGRFLAVSATGGVFIVPASGGLARKVAMARGLDEVAWSSDGCCLLFSAVRGRSDGFDRTGLHVVSVRGGRTRALKKRGISDFAPAWRQ